MSDCGNLITAIENLRVAFESSNLQTPVAIVVETDDERQKFCAEVLKQNKALNFQHTYNSGGSSVYGIDIRCEKKTNDAE